MKAFVSYSHKDQSFCDQLRTHLAVLKGERLIDAWHYQKIQPGGVIDAEISEQLEYCELFLPLVSSDFLDSRYCRDIEMPRALERQRAEHLRIVPVIIRSCDWKASPLGKLVALPNAGNPVSKWDDKDDAFLSVVHGLRRILTEREPIGAVRTTNPVAMPYRETSRNRKYRVRREFDAIDRGKYREQAFAEIRTFFETCAKEINETEGIRAHCFARSTNTFCCTVVNRSIPNGTANINVHTRSSSIALGDIWYSFAENDQGNSAEGVLSVESDEYQLGLRPTLMFSVLMGQDKDKLMSPGTAAEKMWSELLEKAGVSYD